MSTSIDLSKNGSYWCNFPEDNRYVMFAHDEGYHLSHDTDVGDMVVTNDEDEILLRGWFKGIDTDGNIWHQDELFDEFWFSDSSRSINPDFTLKDEYSLEIRIGSRFLNFEIEFFGDLNDF